MLGDGIYLTIRKHSLYVGNHTLAAVKVGGHVIRPGKSAILKVKLAEKCDESGRLYFELDGWMDA